jgi:hypothetical protein
VIVIAPLFESFENSTFPNNSSNMTMKTGLLNQVVQHTTWERNTAASVTDVASVKD